jgi:WD40 repeat protein/class 3 adenylate cyclase
MQLPINSEQRSRVEEFQRRHRVALLTLLFTDIVGSTQIKQQLGDTQAVMLIQQHHSALRNLLAQFPEGEDVETAGDSFFLIFTKPSDAVRFALLWQHRVRALARETGKPLLDRIGIHVGEVFVQEHGNENPGHKAKDLYGLQVDTCARVMGLGQADQILLTRTAFDSARQILKGGELAGLGPLEWLNHGPYAMKGVEDTVEVCEAGESGLAVLKAPGDTEKAHRQVAPGSDPVLGWRPGAGITVPHTQWCLEEKLGEGGVGEVWLARHATLKERRVFKFCFRAELVRTLKREVTLFKVLKERVGTNPHVVTLHDVFFEEPPFYLVTDYAAGGDLVGWCKRHGGVEKIPLPVRLEIVAQIADALQTAQDAGIVHRDVKPSNILLKEAALPKDPLAVRALLGDFGIGQLLNPELVSGVTRAGFTLTIQGPAGPTSGTPIYMAPEVIAGRPSGARSDLYSLGVVLYQLLTGDLNRPLTTDWQQSIGDPLLIADLQRCFAGDLQQRFAGAGELAHQLRSLPARHAQSALERAAQRERERAAQFRGMMRVGALASAIVLIFAGVAGWAWRQTRAARKESVARLEQWHRAEAREKDMQQLLYGAKVNLIQNAWQDYDVKRMRALLTETETDLNRGFEWYYWQQMAHLATKTLRGHGPAGSVRSVRWSPDGERLLNHADNIAIVWDATSGRELFQLKGHFRGITKSAWSPDGRRLLTQSPESTRVWDAVNGRELFVLPGQGEEFTAAEWSPDGGRILFGSTNQVAKICDAASGKELVSFSGHSGVVEAVGWSPDGRQIVTGSADKTAKVWDAGSGRELHSLSGHRETVPIVIFSPDGQLIVTGSGDGLAKVWSATNGRELITLKHLNSNIKSAAWAKDSKRLATGGTLGIAVVWEVTSGRELFTAKGDKNHDMPVSWAPGDREIVVPGEDTKVVKIWDVASGQERLSLQGHLSGVECAAFSPDGRRLATGSHHDGQTKIWDITGELGQLLLKGHRDQVRTVAWSPDGRRILTGSLDQTAKVWDAVSGRELLSLKEPTVGIAPAAWSPDGQRIITGAAMGDKPASKYAASDSGVRTARIWDAASGRELLSLKGHSDGLYAVAFSPDGQRVLTASWDKTAKVWEAATGRELLTFKGHKEGICAAAWSPNGQRFVTGSWDHDAKIWDATTGQELLTLKGHRDHVWTVAFSPDGQRVLTGSWDNTAKVWEAATGRELLTIKGEVFSINSVAWSPDGQRIATASWGHTVKVWDATNGQELLTLRTPETVWSLAWSPDGRRIAASLYCYGTSDTSAVIYDAASPQQVEAWKQEERLAQETEERNERERLEDEKRKMPPSKP